MAETKFAWLIESKTVAGRPVWWTAKHGDGEWTIDANEAVHFTDKALAERIRDYAADHASVTEHGFG